ncbi:exosortase V [Polymorphobacter arshaanensis]|nr:exosortase V [Polymorphobacter arshaanensis]
MATKARLSTIDWSGLFARHGLLLAACLSMVLPTLYSLATGPWTTEAGVQGPIVLATGTWLLLRRLPEIRAKAVHGSLPIATAMMLVAIPLYVFGRAFDFISIEVAALLLALLATAYAYVGFQVLKALWFPIFYLGFMIPLPGWVLDYITLPLKQLVSEVVTTTLQWLGYPVARVGVTIYIAQYQLLVEDACAGLNSLVSLISIGLFYVYILHNSSAKYSILLLMLVIPIAILANVVRVMALVLLTYYFGDAVAQGFLHNFAGMVTFTSALLLIFLVDTLLRPVRRWLGGEDGHAA